MRLKADWSGGIIQSRSIKAAILCAFFYSIILFYVTQTVELCRAETTDTNDGSSTMLICGPTPRQVETESSDEHSIILLDANYPFQDANLPLEDRVDDLISRLTLDEKISLWNDTQPAIPRLGIDSFVISNEALHGIAWLGVATVFPQAIGMGSTWDKDLIKQIGSAVGDEARGFLQSGVDGASLSLRAPVVDPQRDPRAGRSEEGYSEDPYLTGQMSIAYASGMKGDDPFYYKAVPMLKHFYAYNQEENRPTTNVSIDERNKHEYYLEFFRYAIASGAAKSMMTSYNLVNGVPCTVHPDINNIVKGQWAPIDSGADFFVGTDAWAPSNLISPQGYYSDWAYATAGMIKAGIDSPLSEDGDLYGALSEGLITEADIDKSLKNIFRVRFHTGEFDGELDPYKDINSTVINSLEHQVLAREAVCESVVLLKNDGNVLPLDAGSLTSIAVIGPSADRVLLDWYSGTLPYAITPLEGIENRVGGGVTVTYSADDASIAASADVAIVFVGNRPLCENGGWGGYCPPDEGKESIDRTSIDLSSAQESLIENVYALNPNTIVVLISSFPYAINWVNSNVPAILYLSHGGQELGNGLADVLFGDYSPAGRLTVTWYSSLSQIPAITDYDIIDGNRTYMYFEDTPLYPFGHGLTYTTFDYNNLQLSSGSIPDDGNVTVSVDVTNTGSVTSDEVVQLYVKDVAANIKRPIKELLGFERVSLSPAETKTVSFNLPASELVFWDITTHDWFVEGGYYDIMVGSSSEDIRLTTQLYVNGPIAPNVSITSPLDGDKFAIGDDIVIEANATDSDGNVVKVEFFQGTTKLGEDTNEPYSYIWNDVGVGRYNLTAKATDNNGVEATSSAVSIGVMSGDATGYILREWWTGIMGAAVSDLTSDVNYPADPTGRELITALEVPTDWADHYGTRIRGYLYPPTSGSYTFWIASDDSSELWLSTDDDPSHISKIAYVSGWTYSREWTKYPSQESSPITLLASQKYYIEVLQKEHEGLDNVAVAWEGPGITQQVIDGTFLSLVTYGDFTGDNTVNTDDLYKFCGWWLEEACDGTAGLDLNGDCTINFYEYSRFAQNWLKEL